MFCGLSMRIASFILRSWSGQAFVTVILWSSDCLGLLGVGWRTTCIQRHHKWQKKITDLVWFSAGESLFCLSVQHSGATVSLCKGWWLCVFASSEILNCDAVKQQKNTVSLPRRRRTKRGGLISLCWLKELWGSLLSCQLSCSRRSKNSVSDKVTVTTGTSEAPLAQNMPAKLPLLGTCHF